MARSCGRSKCNSPQTPKLSSKVVVLFWVPVPPHLLQQLVWSVFLISSILVCAACSPIMVLICVSLVTNGVEHLPMCLLANHVFWKSSVGATCLFVFAVCLFTTDLLYFIFSAHKFLVVFSQFLAAFTFWCILMRRGHVFPFCNIFRKTLPSQGCEMLSRVFF